MAFELLANELLLDTFEFLNGVDVLRAFQGLNLRFDLLLFKYFRAYHLDFRSVSKSDFDLICQRYIPLIIDRVNLLRLSSDDDTPGQIDCLYSHHLSLCQFTNLRSLSLYYIHSVQTMTKMMDELPYLLQLTHLNINKCHVPHFASDFHRVSNNIWSLPNLTDCYLNIIQEHGNYHPSPTVISWSLKHLFLESGTCSLTILSNIFQHTPHLRYLHASFSDYHKDQKLTHSVLSITKLNLNVGNSTNALINLLENMSNLRHLTIEGSYINIDGHGWADIITKYLPKLKKFQLKMQIESSNTDREEGTDQLIQSFRTHFWLEEHRWYVRCHWDPQSHYKNIHFYTVPYAFTKFDYVVDYLSKSTCLDDDNNWSYDHVHILDYRPFSSIKESSLENIRFPNIDQLTLRIPFDNHFWSVFPRLDHLIFLRLKLNNDIQCQLQTLLDQAPCLVSLNIDVWPSPQILETEYTNISIRQLDLRATEIGNGQTWFNSQQCALLSHSSLGKQCEVLKIRVENRINIIDLVNTMTKLRALNIECREDTYHKIYDSSSTDDELIQWLEDRLSPTCMITRAVKRTIHLWIR